MEAIDLRESVKQFLDQHSGLAKNGEGDYEEECYASYDDALDDESIAEILESDDPEFDLQDRIEQMYEYTLDEMKDDLEKDARDFIEEKYGRISDDENESLRDILAEVVSVKLPVEHFLDQPIQIDIWLDTGDGNYDYTLNCTYPAWGGSEELDQLASLRLIGELQGYSLKDLREALKKGDVPEPEGFLDSVRQEVANESSQINVLTILVKMTLKEAIKLNELIRAAEKTGNEYYPYKRPDCGSVKIGKDSTVGLFDPWNGGGSCFEIELEKDVDIPVRYIRYALPDGQRLHWRYSVVSVYGMMGDAWKESVLEINPPKGVTA